jgi:hypothetical protein
MERNKNRKRIWLIIKKIILEKLDSMQCELMFLINKIILSLVYRLEKNQVKNNGWIDQIKDRLFRVMRHRKKLITIFKFDSERHHGNLEDAILEALFNGLYD